MFIIKIACEQIDEIAAEFMEEFGNKKVKIRKAEYVLHVDTNDRDRIYQVIDKKNLPVYVEERK